MNLLVLKKDFILLKKLFLKYGHSPALSVSKVRPPISQSFTQKGFTLLEVMVALAILAVIAITASQASRSYLNAVSNIKTRTLAHYIAENTLADLRINQIWITQPETRQIQENGRQWQVTITPTATSALQDSAMAAYIRPISISVAPITQAGIQNSVSTLEAVISKPTGNLP